VHALTPFVFLSLYLALFLAHRAPGRAAGLDVRRPREVLEGVKPGERVVTEGSFFCVARRHGRGRADSGAM